MLQVIILDHIPVVIVIKDFCHNQTYTKYTLKIVVGLHVSN